MTNFVFTDFLQLAIGSLCDGSIYAVIGLAFMVIYRTTNILNFAQGDFVMLGAVFTITFVRLTQFPLFLCALLAVFLTVLVGLVAERYGNRVFVTRKAPLLVQTFATIGISMIIQTSVLVAWGRDPMALAPFTGDTPLSVLGAAILPQSLWVIGVVILSLALSKAFLDHTMAGKAMRACADNPAGASVIGLEKNKMVQFSFAMSAGLAAIIGITMTPLYYTSYSFGTLLTVKGFIAAIIGGMYNPFGAVLGGLMLGFLENFASGLISSSYKDLISLMVLIVVLFLRKASRTELEVQK